MTSSSDEPSKWQRHVHSFDIDNYLNRFVPRPRFYLLPRPISHFFGYRSPSSKPVSPPGNPIIWLSSCIGGFVGIAIITAVYHALPQLGGQQVPLVIASFGAAAILEYNTIESPLSQPRNLIVGHFLSALVGVAITKAFEQLPEQRFEQLRWLAGSVSVGLASVVMSITKTIHPPAGATALLASTSVEVNVLGWWLLPLVLLASCLMCASALIVNNVTRRWPIYWWTPVDLSNTDRSSDIKHVKDVEKQVQPGRFSTDSRSTAASKSKQCQHIERQETPHVITPRAQLAGAVEDTSHASHTIGETAATRASTKDQSTIIIGPDTIVIPDDMETDEWEREILEIFRAKLAGKQQP